MNLNKKLKPFISLVCAILLILPTVIPVAAADTNSVTATTSATVKQGYSGTCYVYIDSTEGLAALDVTVHFDPAKVKITNVYNSISCTLYDSVTNTDNIQFSYILDGKGTASKTQLFYFRYKVLSNAEVGSTYFDITVGEAYDSSLNEMAVSGSRCSFSVAETVTNKSCSIYGNSSATSAIGQEFTLSYRISTYQIASGTAMISYDPELFEVVGVTEGGFLTDKIVDINTDLTGEIYISFVGIEYYSNTNLVSVTFKTIKNVTETSKIILKTPELLDKELNSISCSGYTTSVSITFDETYAGDAPAMSLDGAFSYDDMQITLTVSLEENSKLGAGDFVISFDPELVSYNSCEKGFAPSFFYINDKNADAGQLKFHIISLSDIVTEEKVLTVVFDVKHPYGCETADFTLDGTGLTDSLTESILLNFRDTSVPLEYLVTFRDWDGKVLDASLYRYGDTVSEPAAPTRGSDVYGKYTFAGWDRDILPCTEDRVYTATYDLEYTDYTVTFKNWNGEILSTALCHYGDEIIPPAAPERAADRTYIYTFEGWDKELVCIGDMTLTARYSASKPGGDSIGIAPGLSVDNYVVTITEADNIKDMRYALGEYTTTTEIRNAAGNVALDNGVVTNNTSDGKFVYTMPNGGMYSIWIRMKDGTNYILPLDMTKFTPTVDTYGVKITVDGLYDVKDCFIAKGEFNTYNEIKNNGYIVRLTSNKIAGKHNYTYTVSDPGMHTILVRYNNGTEYIFHKELTVDEPTFTTNGLQVTISNIPDVKVIRTAYGEYYTPGDTKRAPGARNFSNKSVIKDAEEYMLQYREEGRVTIIVEYNNGYVKVFHYDVTKKDPAMEQDGNTVTFSNLNGLVMIRYAVGEYSTSNDIKKAPGSKVIKPDTIVDGKITVTDLAIGTYTFCVQYDDDSYNYYTVTVE